MVAVFFILGMRRSGNHMFIHFLLSNFHRIFFMNNVRLSTTDWTRYIVGSNSLMVGNKELASRLVGNIHDDPDCLIFTMEDISVDEFDCTIKHIYNIFPIATVQTSTHSIIIMRDLLNCISSRLAAHQGELITPVNDHMINLWKEQFYCEIHDKILYNKFVSSSDYRKEITLRLGLTNSSSVTSVPLFFGGSSFDRNSNIPQEISSYSKRYISFCEHPVLLSLLQDASFMDRVQNVFEIRYEIT